MTESVIAIVVIVVGLIAEIVRRGLIRRDEARQAKKDFDEKRDQAIASDDIAGRYNH